MFEKDKLTRECRATHGAAPTQVDSRDGNGNGSCHADSIDDCPQTTEDKLAKKLLPSGRRVPFAVLADATPNIVWCADELGSVIYFNSRWFEYTGLDDERSLGSAWLSAVHPDDKPDLEFLWSEAVRNRQQFDCDLRLRDAAGAYRWFKCRSLPQTDEGDEKIHWVGSCSDIDDTKSAKELLERRVQERTAQLEQLNKDLEVARDRALEASSIKSKFVANISHEIRTPMSGVLGMSELLLTCQLDDEARELAQYIHTSAKALLDVVNDLLDFSKLEAGKLTISRTRLSIEKVVMEAAQSTAVAANQKGLLFSVNVEPDLPDVYGDSGRIRQVLLNLVHNAIKFTSKGSVVVDVRAVNHTKNALWVRFTVSDTGIGISEESREHLFNPFEQADGSTTRKYGGTGLGLSISKSLVQLMLGQIGLHSEENKGSTFWFEVPLELA